MSSLTTVSFSLQETGMKTCYSLPCMRGMNYAGEKVRGCGNVWVEIWGGAGRLNGQLLCATAQ